jgi:hypothetical protein
VVVELPVAKDLIMFWLGSAEEKSLKNMVTATLESRSVFSFRSRSIALKN